MEAEQHELLALVALLPLVGVVSEFLREHHPCPLQCPEIILPIHKDLRSNSQPKERATGLASAMPPTKAHDNERAELGNTSSTWMSQQDWHL
ncbi:unnamed protein product [Gongylonema pulchrum]|uniref:Secreted protein n=1 Tax=Gongylonema pulchrum TaxID=637853 RepID=A0A183DWV6_9BILA|nr:unnamed protein product [Gongylonema pulchrum]